MANKVCNKCGATKPATDDYFPTMPSGRLRPCCRICRNERKGYKVCTKCGTEKLANRDNFGSMPRGGLRGSCRECMAKAANKHNKENPDMQDSRYNTQLGVYKEHCGLDDVKCSWGHDEYMSKVLKRNINSLPDEAIYLIRYHSFYSWHTPMKNSKRSYLDLASEYDWKMLPLLKAFQKSDLYSKSRKVPQITEIKSKYNILINQSRI